LSKILSIIGRLKRIAGKIGRKKHNRLIPIFEAMKGIRPVSNMPAYCTIKAKQV